MRRTVKALIKSLDDLNDVLDECSETGDVEFVKHTWNNDITKSYNVLKDHLAIISEYDDAILTTTSSHLDTGANEKKYLP